MIPQEMDDNQVIYMALNQWSNYIQTGDICMSQQDAINCGDKDKIKAINQEQMKFIIRLQDLAKKYLFGDGDDLAIKKGF